MRAHTSPPINPAPPPKWTRKSNFFNGNCPHFCNFCIAFMLIFRAAFLRIFTCPLFSPSVLIYETEIYFIITNSNHHYVKKLFGFKAFSTQNKASKDVQLFSPFFRFGQQHTYCHFSVFITTTDDENVSCVCVCITSHGLWIDSGLERKIYW